MPPASVYTTHRGIRCLRCRFWTQRPREQPSGEPSPPRPGDFWLCSKCGEIHRFGEFLLRGGMPALSIRRAELEELADLAPVDAADLLKIRDRIRGGAN